MKRWLLVIGLAAGLGACGGSGQNPSLETHTTTVAVTRTIVAAPPVTVTQMTTVPSSQTVAPCTHTTISAAPSSNPAQQGANAARPSGVPGNLFGMWSSSGTSGCARFRQHEFEVCVAYLFNDTGARRNYYQHGKDHSEASFFTRVRYNALYDCGASRGATLADLALCRMRYRWGAKTLWYYLQVQNCKPSRAVCDSERSSDV